MGSIYYYSMSDVLTNKNEAQTRAEKLTALIKLGVNPFASKTRRQAPITEVKNKTGEKFWVAGRIAAIRSHGKSTFIDLKDESGTMQVYFKSDDLGDRYDMLKLFDNGDFIEVYGEVFVTKMGEQTIHADDFALLTKSLLPLPDQWSGLKDIEARFRKRFVDLNLNPAVKKNLQKRAQIVKELRSFMDKNGFTEVETPILQPIPGGAAAKPFVTHYNILDSDFYLRVAPELFLKRLVVGGFEKIYEIGKAFRNEGVSHMHNPEFTIFEFYWAYQDYNGLMDFTETMLTDIITKVNGSLKVTYQGKEIDFTPPYPRVAFTDLVKKDCGVDITAHTEFEDLKKEVEKAGIKLDNMKEITVWAKLVDELYKKVSRPNIVNPIFVVDHPTELVPLAKAKEGDSRRVQKFQPVCAGGIELVNAYTELNDPIDQENRFKEQVAMRKKGFDESQQLDSNYIEALKYGLPPTAGWGMGIDRLVMLLTDQWSIKEVIAFPTLKPEQ